MTNDDSFNKFLYVGIDAHQEEHTAVMATRFEEEKGNLNFANNTYGIKQFLAWLEKEKGKQKVAVGIEGGGRTRDFLVYSLLKENYIVCEVNPLYTKQRRDYGTKGNKSDLVDARLVVEVLTRKFDQLPKLRLVDFQPQKLNLKKIVSFYEESVCQRTRIKNQLKVLLKERKFKNDKEERSVLNLIIGEKKKDLKRKLELEEKLKQKLTFLLDGNSYNLTTIKGISTILAAKIVAQTKGIERFNNIDKFIKYAGIAPLERSSGKTKRYQKSKIGNRKLNCAFYLVALNQLRWNPKARKYFQKKIEEGKTKKQALRCLMKRVACIVYGILKSRKPCLT